MLPRICSSTSTTSRVGGYNQTDRLIPISWVTTRSVNKSRLHISKCTRFSVVSQAQIHIFSISVLRCTNTWDFSHNSTRTLRTPIWNCKSLSKVVCFPPALIADELHTHRYELASTLGVKNEALTRASRVQSKKIQSLLRGMLEILSRVETKTGSPLLAYAWYRGVPIPGFGGMTADRLVREGKIDAVRTYLDEVDDGIYA